MKDRVIYRNGFANMTAAIAGTKVGFTGTQNGMTLKQRRTFAKVIGLIGPIAEFHHGDCEGADFDAHIMMTHELGAYIVRHPPINSSKRAFCVPYDEEWPKKEYLERNHEIVNSTDVLIAAPKEATEVLRSGTWATFRYAVKQGKSVFLILPSGAIQHKAPKR